MESYNQKLIDSIVPGDCLIVKNKAGVVFKQFHLIVSEKGDSRIVGRRISNNPDATPVDGFILRKGDYNRIIEKCVVGGRRTRRTNKSKRNTTRRR